MSDSKLFNDVSSNEDEHWISVSDLMAGLMVIFLFIAVSYIKDVVVEKERIQSIAIIWNETQESLYQDLYSEFKDDLRDWNALLNRDTLSIRFQEPTVLFDTGEATLKEGFEEILDDFFPRYLNILNKYQDDIAEVRIEGHTSSDWIGAHSEIDAYFKNMQLSQDRTRSVLQYCLEMSNIGKNRDWAKAVITANGLSSSRPILTDADIEDAALSRRVEFRVRTNAERRIVEILQGDN